MTNQDRPKLQIFLTFLKLGCIAFGGPIAHLGHFREEFVNKLKWITESEYPDLVALCQFLPGPASSQVGFAIGRHKGGTIGAFLAWSGFTLPSAVLMIGFAQGLSALGDLQGAAWITGLKLAAVAVVANAVWAMAAKLCPDRKRALIAVGSASILLLATDALWQIVVIALGAITGWLDVAEGFYRAGSLVFGGGHVVLPLLDSFTVGQGWIDHGTFLAGYGAAQALPGPLFAFTSFLGASINHGPQGINGGLLALAFTYLPSWLLVLGCLPYWDRLRRLKSAQAALMGTNAAVVGVLLAALYNPIWTAAITDSSRLAFALLAFALLKFVSTPPWLLVVLSAIAGVYCF